MAFTMNFARALVTAAIVAAAIFETNPAGTLELERPRVRAASGIGLGEVGGHRLDRAQVSLEARQIRRRAGRKYQLKRNRRQ